MQIDQAAIEKIADSILKVIEKKLSENNTKVVGNALKNHKVDGDHIVRESIGNVHIKDAAIDTAKIKDLTAEVAQIAVAEIASATIDVAQINSLSAYVADIVYATIESADIEWADIANLTATIAAIAVANIETARIDFAQIDGLVAGVALIQEAVGGKVQIADLSVSDANIVTLNANKIQAGTLSAERLVIVGSTESIVYAVNEANGTAQLSQTTIDGGSITQKTITADQIIAHGITADCLNVAEIFANEALIGAITTDNIAAGTITAASAIIADGAITTAKIENAQITSAKIADANITTAKIGDAQITGAKIEDATITGAKIANATITNANIAEATINSANIGDGQITTAKIGDAQITNAKINDLNASKINAGTLSADRIAAGSITTDKLGASAITADKLAADAVEARHISAGAITTSKLASDVGSSLDISSNESITLAVGQTLGNPNLLLRSDYEDGWDASGFWTHTTNTTNRAIGVVNTTQYAGHNSIKMLVSGYTTVSGAAYQQAIDPALWQVGDTLTVSAYFKMDTGNPLDSYAGFMLVCRVNGSDTYPSIRVIPSDLSDGDWHRIKFTHTILAGTTAITFRVDNKLNGTTWMACPKVEKGAIATGWCLAASEFDNTTTGRFDKDGLKISQTGKGTYFKADASDCGFYNGSDNQMLAGIGVDESGNGRFYANSFQEPNSGTQFRLEFNSEIKGEADATWKDYGIVFKNGSTSLGKIMSTLETYGADGTIPGGTITGLTIDAEGKILTLKTEGEQSSGEPNCYLDMDQAQGSTQFGYSKYDISDDSSVGDTYASVWANATGTGLSYEAGTNNQTISFEGRHYSDASSSLRFMLAGSIMPETDDRYNLGFPAYRFSKIYSNNALNGSDRRIKNSIVDIVRAKDFVLALRPRAYKLNGDDDGKTHLGFIAQEVKEAMDKSGQAAFGGYDDTDPDALCLGYNEFIAPLVALVQAQEKRIAALEERIAVLEEYLLHDR